MAVSAWHALVPHPSKIERRRVRAVYLGAAVKLRIVLIVLAQVFLEPRLIVVSLLHVEAGELEHVLQGDVLSLLVTVLDGSGVVNLHRHDGDELDYSAVCEEIADIVVEKRLVRPVVVVLDGTVRHHVLDGHEQVVAQYLIQVNLLRLAYCGCDIFFAQVVRDVRQAFDCRR